MLAAVIVFDQFPRNMFRGTPRAFATDPLALALARRMVDTGLDRDLSKDERMFLYLPFEHSEQAAEQARCCALFALLEDADCCATRRHTRISSIVLGGFRIATRFSGARPRPRKSNSLRQPGSSF